MDNKNQSVLEDIFIYLPPRIKPVFMKLSENMQREITEIRLRADKPLMIVTKAGSAFLSSAGKPCYICSQTFPVITRAELCDTVTKMCGYSVYSHQNDLVNGFITLKNGCRVGICGTAVSENSKITAIRDLTSVNIRVSREIKGCADEIVNKLLKRGLKNIIIAGAPMSGKTTVLKDLVRQASDGFIDSFYKCAVIDERGELACLKDEKTAMNADVLSFYPKDYGIMTAVRSLSPDIVFCDEISSKTDAEAVINGISCGAKFILTAHASTLGELLTRQGVAEILNSSLIDAAVFLGTGSELGKVREIYNFGAEEYENSGTCDDVCSFLYNGNYESDSGYKKGGRTFSDNINVEAYKGADFIHIDAG